MLDDLKHLSYSIQCPLCFYSDQFDPFNRQPLTMDMVKPAVELKQQIDAWLAENKRKSDSE
jgi:hypothetical protein